VQKQLLYRKYCTNVHDSPPFNIPLDLEEVPMNSQDIADVLTSCWTLAVGPGKKLPSGQNVLDRALKIAIEEGNFPPEFKQLRFVKTRTGVRCAELSSALSWAQASDQTADPNPAYDTTMVKPSAFVGSLVLQELGIPIDDARAWGLALFEAVKQEQQNNSKQSGN
jgi:hypothetical protein